jgi:putative transposase
MKLTRNTLESMIVSHPEPTMEQPQGSFSDKGHDCREARDLAAEFGSTAHSRMDRLRRTLVRWEKKPAHHIVFLHYACGLIAFRAAEF